MLTSTATLKRIQTVLHAYLPKEPRYQAFLFGSRVCGRVREKSDFDIGVMGEMRLNSIIKEQIENEFMNIPALIDFVDFHEVNPDFRSQVFEKWIQEL